MKRLALVPLGTIAIAISGCGFLLTGTTDPGRMAEILKAEKARGCVYARASGRPWADAGLLLVGTWGVNPPTYAECWQGLPPGGP